MDWLNLHTSVLDSPEVVGAEPTDRATWLFLLRFCAGQENMGVIADCRAWADRKWQQLARVTLAEVDRATDLWRWEGDALRVNFYPEAKQREVEAKREAGRLTVAKRWPKQDSSACSSAISSAKCSPYTEVEGKENRKEKEKTATPLPFGSAEFLAAWELFTKHRSEIRKPLKPTSASMALKQLSAMGEERAIRCIEHTVAKGWQGLREPDARDVRQPSLAPEFNKF